jgi:hypothetical protein
MTRTTTATAFLALCGFAAHANPLPEVPAPKIPTDAEISAPQIDRAPLTKERTADAKFWIVAGALGGSAAADYLSTSRLPWTKFHENDPLYGRYPTGARLAAVGGCFYAAELTAAYLLKRYGQHHHWRNTTLNLEGNDVSRNKTSI